MRIRTFTFLCLCVVAIVVAGCYEENSSSKQSEQQEIMRSQAVSSVGMPAITNWQELRFVKMLYELRDSGTTTHTYITEINGKPAYKLCDSVGYGLPYSVQFSAPERMEKIYQGRWERMPQSEPNGLFMPDSAEGTWVMCLDPADKSIKPVYVEPKVIVSPFPLSVN